MRHRLLQSGGADGCYRLPFFGAGQQLTALTSSDSFRRFTSILTHKRRINGESLPSSNELRCDHPITPVAGPNSTAQSAGWATRSTSWGLTQGSHSRAIYHIRVAHPVMKVDRQFPQVKRVIVGIGARFVGMAYAPCRLWGGCTADAAKGRGGASGIKNLNALKTSSVNFR